MFCFDAAKKKIVAVIAYLKLKLLLTKGRGESWTQILSLLWYYVEVCDHLIYKFKLLEKRHNYLLMLDLYDASSRAGLTQMMI